MISKGIIKWCLWNVLCCRGYSFELHQQVDAVQMGTHNTCLHKEVDRIDCILKTTKLLDCLFIGVCAVIRSNMKLYPDIKFLFFHKKNICFGFSLETPQHGAFNEYPQHIFFWRNKKEYLQFWYIQGPIWSYALNPQNNLPGALFYTANFTNN